MFIIGCGFPPPGRPLEAYDPVKHWVGRFVLCWIVSSPPSPFPLSFTRSCVLLSSCPRLLSWGSGDFWCLCLDLALPGVPEALVALHSADSDKYQTREEFCAAYSRHGLEVRADHTLGKRRPAWCNICHYAVECDGKGNDGIPLLRQHLKKKAHRDIDANPSSGDPVLISPPCLSPSPPPLAICDATESTDAAPPSSTKSNNLTAPPSSKKSGNLTSNYVKCTGFHTWEDERRCNLLSIYVDSCISWITMELVFGTQWFSASYEERGVSVQAKPPKKYELLVNKDWKLHVP